MSWLVATNWTSVVKLHVILMMVDGGLWWFMVVYYGLWWFAWSFIPGNPWEYRCPHISPFHGLMTNLYKMGIIHFFAAQMLFILHQTRKSCAFIRKFHFRIRQTKHTNWSFPKFRGLLCANPPMFSSGFQWSNWLKKNSCVLCLRPTRSPENCLRSASVMGIAHRGTKEFIKYEPGWWFQPLWKILINWDDYPQYMEKKSCSKPPTRISHDMSWRKIVLCSEDSLCFNMLAVFHMWLPHLVSVLRCSKMF